MVKKLSTKSKKHIQRTDTHWLIRRSMVSYAVIVFLVFCMLCLSVYLLNRLIVNHENNNRLDKINAVYTSLNLDNSYRLVKSNVFGDKRVYSYDPGRTFSSSVEYAHNDTPANTTADLRKKIEAAGFTYVQTEYEGSTNPVIEFKNSTGNWVRVGVTSKFVQDAIVYGTANESDPLINHKDEAPSYVTVKVNLDDNNE